MLFVIIVVSFTILDSKFLLSIIYNGLDSIYRHINKISNGLELIHSAKIELYMDCLVRFLSYELIQTGLIFY